MIRLYKYIRARIRRRKLIKQIEKIRENREKPHKPYGLPFFEFYPI